VLVMGIGYDSSLWTLQQVPALSTRFQVVLLDNRDAGRSSRAAHPYAIADMADDLAGMLDALHLHRTHLVGLSMGSMIGMEFALRHADRLDRLVLAGAGAAPARSAVDPISIWSWVKANDPSGEVFGGQQFTWLFSSAFLRNQPAVRETIALLASNPNPVEPDAYGRQAQAYLQFDALDRLSGIQAPTLVIVGEQDLLTPPWVAREVASGIPGARFEIVAGDGSSHVLPLERPDDFNQLVMNFLAE
jgi:pimeloyl-ACP methyl ester carboxylesterase